MLRLGLIAIAVLTVFAALALGVGSPSSFVSDADQTIAMQSVQDAIDSARHLAKHDNYGANVVFTNGPNSWQGVLWELASSGANASGTESQYFGKGSVALSGASSTNTLTVFADPAGNVTATQGSIVKTCPLTITVDGGSVTYEC